MKSKDVELCQTLDNALTSLRSARLTTGYVAVTERLRESEALDLDGIISALKSIYLVACHTVVEDAEKSEEGTVVDDHEQHFLGRSSSQRRRFADAV